jgi:hypothetical protein
MVGLIIGLLGLTIGTLSLARPDPGRNDAKISTEKDTRQTPGSVPTAGPRPANPSEPAASECLVTREAGAVYPTIQAAVNRSDCGTITIAPGTYQESLTIQRSLTLQGASTSKHYWEDVIINGRGDGPILVDGENITVVIERLTLSGGGDYGIHVAGSAKVTIQDNEISDNPGYFANGVEARDNSEVTIQYNNICRNGFGGIWKSESANVTIKNNRICDNVDGDGIFLADSGDAGIWDNEITGNAWCGVTLSDISDFPWVGQLSGERNHVSDNVEGQLCGQGFPSNFLGIPVPPLGPRPTRVRFWPLFSGITQTGSVKAHDISRPKVTVQTGEKKETQYGIEIPGEGAELLAIVLQAQEGGNLDLYASVGKPVSVQTPAGQIRIRSDFASISPGGEEVLVISSNLKPKTVYWFVVENREGTDQKFSLTAWLLPEILDGQGAANGRVGIPGNLPPPLARYLQTDRGELGLQQYRVEIPQGAKQLKVELTGSGDLYLHLRLGQPVAIGDDGRVAADVSVISAGDTKTIVLAGKSLQTGIYYIAIEGLNPPQDFTLTVTLETKEGSSQTAIGGRLTKGAMPALVDLP